MNTSSLLRSAFTAAAITTATLLGNITTAEAVEVTVTIDNLSPEEGIVLTPFWVGFHDGSYDLYDPGVAASEGLALIAEDGDVSLLSAAFSAGNVDRVDGVITGSGIGPGSPPLIGPGSSATLTLDVDEMTPFLSFASMILPSNDAFIGNESGTSHRLFDADGNFIGTDFVVIGSQIQDAGSEINDESPESVPLLGMAHLVGPTENSTVMAHPGFEAGGNILSAFPGADFKDSLYPLARIRVELAE
ncbi:MAG: spondin domain-containing protein [Cyanobacteria bacterium J06634_6]